VKLMKLVKVMKEPADPVFRLRRIKAWRVQPNESN